MPPLPKRKYPKARQGKRRSHHAATVPHIVTCPRCRGPQMAHRACPICGTYRGRQAIPMPAPELEG
ncbi:MAG: 50S ribosomal protein L32 [Dehalococcoidia bacterium]